MLCVFGFLCALSVSAVELLGHNDVLTNGTKAPDLIDTLQTQF
jgi:hypothetical protein